MAVPSITSISRRKARSTYRRQGLRIVEPPARPAAHRSARVTPNPTQLAAIRRRRAFVRRITPLVIAAAYWTVHALAAVAGFAVITAWMFLLLIAPTAAAWGLSLAVCMWGLYRVRTAATR